MKVVKVNFAEKRAPPKKQAAPAVVVAFPKSQTFIVRQARDFFKVRIGNGN